MSFFPIALAGFIGCGKTTVGRLVADAAGVPFNDLDLFLEELSCEPLAELRERLGEHGFRELETLSLSRLAASGGVTALNADCVMPIKSRRVLTRGFEIFFIDAPFELLYDRVRGTARRQLMSLSASELRMLYELRRPLYTAVADHLLDGTLTPHEIAKSVISELPFIRSPFSRRRSILP